MKLLGPEHYELRFNARTFRVYSTSGDNKLSRRVNTPRPKLYVVARGTRLLYVGITNQPIRSRLRLGWSAKGESGYYGYAWRHRFKAARLFVWFHPRSRGKSAIRYLETVEAEVVYLVRKQGQWLPFQTEIHFHASHAAHRRAAESVVAYVQHAR